jgi:hypothetical protein
MQDTNQEKEAYDPTSQGDWRLTILDAGEIIDATRTLRRTAGATRHELTG